MKLFIQVLDNGYILSVAQMVPDIDGPEENSVKEVKTRYAFETVGALKAKLNELLPNPPEA